MEVREDPVINEPFVMSSPTQPNFTSVQYSYQKQQSTDSGWENPFRPDGDLSKEADEIVELIKEGKPIAPIQGNPSLLLQENGTSKSGDKFKCNIDKKIVTGVEVQKGKAATPTEPSQVELVVIKKKPKCKCCVVQ